MSGSVVNVVVTTLLGEKVPLAIDSGTTGAKLKDLVRQKAEVPKQFRLGFKSVGLAAKRALSEAGIPDGAEIWMSKSESPPTLSGHAQALGRVARGKQVAGSIKHAIAAVDGNLTRAINTRADRTDAKIDANLVATTEILSRINGEEVPRVPGQTDIARMKQLRSTKHNADQELTDIKERERLRKRQNKIDDNSAMHDAAVVAEGAFQTGFQNIDSVQKCVEMGKALAARKRQLKLEEAVVVEGQPAEKKPRKGSKAWKAAEAAKALAVPDALQLESNATDLAASDEEDTLRDPVMDVAALSAVSVVSTTN